MEDRVAKKGKKTSKTRVPVKKRRPSRQATESQQNASRHFEKIVEMGNDGIFVFDDRCKILFSNQMASEITGIPREDLISQDFFSIIGIQNKDFLAESFTQEDGFGQKLCMEMGITTPQGQSKHAEARIPVDHPNEGAD